MGNQAVSLLVRLSFATLLRCFGVLDCPKKYVDNQKLNENSNIFPNSSSIFAMIILILIMAKKKTSEKELSEWLNGNNSTKFQKAVKYIANNGLVKFSDQLFNLLELKYNTLNGASQSRYYDIYYLSMALGDLNYHKAIPVLEKIAKESGYIHCVGAGVAYIRLVRKDKNDFSKVFEFVEFHKERMSKQLWGCGTDMSAFITISNDKMVPVIDDQEKFIEFAWDYITRMELQEEGYTDACVALIASSLAGFEKQLTKSILYKIFEYGIMTKGYVQDFAKDALNGKYTYYNPTS